MFSEFFLTQRVAPLNFAGMRPRVTAEQLRETHDMYKKAGRR